MNETIVVNDLIWFLLVGGLAGWLASVLVMGGGMGILADIAVGVAGAFVGGFLARFFQWNVYGFWEVLGISILGAILLLLLFRSVYGVRRVV